MEDLIEYLTDEFPDVSIDDIDLAVKMAISGKLVVLDSKGREIGAESYNDFSALYLTRILNPYKQFRGTVVRKYYEIEEAQRKEAAKADQKPLTPDEVWANNKRHAISCYDSFKNDMPMAGLQYVYDTLLKAGLLPDSEQRMEKFKGLAKENLENEARRGSSKARGLLEIMKSTDVLRSTASLEHEAKILTVKAYFAELKQMDAELEHYLGDKETPKLDC